MNTDKLAAYYKGIFDHGASKGAEAMREAAAQECFDRQADRHGDHEDAWNEACLHCCERVRALPLPPAQPFAPSAEAMREAAVKSIRDDKFQWRSHEHGVTVGLALTDAAVRVSLLPLTLTQPAAVGDEPPAMESVTAEALPSDAALSSIPEAEIEVHPYTTTGYQPAARPTQGHPGHGATMDGVPLVTLEVPVGEIEAVRPATDGLHCVYGRCQRIPNSGRPCNPGCYFQMSAVSDLELLTRLQSPTPAGEIKIADLVTTEMRQAAINYYSSVHKEHVLTPIGDINGIIYAALSASPAIRGFLSRAPTLPAVLTPIPTAEIEARGTHRLLAQWVTIIERREDGVRVRYEDGSISREIISYDLIVDMEAVGRLQSPTPAGQSCHIDRLVACVHDWNDAFQDQHYKAAPEYVPMLRDTLSAIHRAVLAALGAGLCPEDAVVLGAWVKEHGGAGE